MDQIIYFFKHLFDASDWPARWHCGKWTEFHGWLFIISDLVIWLAYFLIPVVIIKYISRRQDARFVRLYFLFAAFILACGATHFLDAVAFWYPAYRLSAVMRFITAVVSVATVFQLVRYLPAAFSLKTGKQLQIEIDLRKEAEEKLMLLNNELEIRVVERTGELEKSLQEVAAYKHALDESSIIAITDQKGIIMHTNDNFCRISQYSREELLGKDHRIVSSGFHSKEFIRDLWVTIANGKVWKGELKNKAKDGSFYWVDTTIVPFMDEKEKPYQYVAIRNDITERKLAEEELVLTMKQLADYKYAIDETAMVAMVDEAKTTLYVNDNFCDTYQYSRDELVGKSFVEFNARFNARELMTEISTIVAEGKIWRGELQGMDKSGNLHWFDNTVVPFLNDKGKPYQFLNIRRDITERKKAEKQLVESEQLYRAIASNIPGSMIVLLNRDCQYLLAEGDLLKEIGYSREALLGNKAQDVLHPGLYEYFKRNCERAFNGEAFDVESQREGFELFTKYIPLKDKEEQVYSVLVVALDVSALKKAQHQLEQLNNELEQKVSERTTELNAINKELESFSYSVSHDLRAPLRAISGYTEMIEEDYQKCLDKEGIRLLSIIQNNATRMGVLIDDLLAFSHLGKKELQKSLVNMNELLASVIDDLETSSRYRAHITIGKLEPVFADRSLIKQVLINFISNALKYSSKVGNPAIIISSVQENGNIVYSIEDNGDGFEPQYAHKLFQVFERLHASDDFEGTGVGLAIVKRIIDKHGGQVWAKGETGKGAIFYFSLPM